MESAAFHRAVRKAEKVRFEQWRGGGMFLAKNKAVGGAPGRLWEEQRGPMASVA